MISEKIGGKTKKFDILKIIESRNAQEAIIGTLIEEFAEKIEDLLAT